MRDQNRADHRLHAASFPFVGMSLGIAVAVTLTGSATADDTGVAAGQVVWGSDHVGQPFPEYMTGDECLFCHRAIGSTWNNNPHQLTIRPVNSDDPAMKRMLELPGGEEAAAQAQFLMGSRRITRFLRRSAEYGKLEILSASIVPSDGHTGERRQSGPLRWDTNTFGDRCAGCHTTAVDVVSWAFSALSLDCVTCHGDVTLEHTDDASRVLLSMSNRASHHVISLCGQCHLRGGQSSSTKRPYPNTFVAGDNLFRDFQVDFSDTAIAALPEAERHIVLNSRDVAIFGRSETSCLSCHDVHGPSTHRHQQLDDVAICASCHVPGTAAFDLRHGLRPANRLQSHSRVCDY